MNRRRLIATAAGILFCMSGAAVFAEELVRTPAQTKAVYTAYLADYSTWPDAAAGSSEGNFVIGVVGRDPNDVMDPILERISSAKGMILKERPVVVVNVAVGELTGEQQLSAVLGDCHMLFFSADSHAEWLRLKPLLDGRPIMTVSEMPGFARQGGMVEYEYDPGAQKMYMIFNMRALKEADLLVSARLLSLKISRPINQEADQ